MAISLTILLAGFLDSVLALRRIRAQRKPAAGSLF
jgi:hypothetical protein